jgi:benzoate membrane transport protein
MVVGGIAIVASGQLGEAEIAWTLPAVAIPGMAFTLPAFTAITMPMIILAMGLGNVQGLGFLMAQGYKIQVTAITVVVGITSIINALFGGHAAIVARTGVAILAAPDAGPKPTRYWANIIAASLTIGLAFAAAPVMSLIGVLPKSYIFALAGLAVLSALQDAFEKAFGAGLKFGALIAFGVAVTPFALAGISSAFWAIIAGIIASLFVERSQLLAIWKNGNTEEKTE